PSLYHPVSFYCATILSLLLSFSFFFTPPPPTPPPPLSLHDALPISSCSRATTIRWTPRRSMTPRRSSPACPPMSMCGHAGDERRDRKSTRLNSSHVSISYAVFCLKKKTKKTAM